MFYLLDVIYFIIHISAHKKQGKLWQDVEGFLVIFLASIKLQLAFPNLKALSKLLHH